MKNLLSFNSTNLTGHYIKIDEACTDCDACLGACPNQILTASFRGLAKLKKTHSERCDGCGACADVCPMDAITITTS